MKQTAGLVLALAGAAPALAGTANDREMRPRNDGLPTLAAAGQDIAAALAEGRSLLAAGNAAQAISAFRLALGQDGQSVAALNGIAIAYDRLGRIDLARQHFELALSIEPDAADIAYNLGWTLHRAGQHRAAISWLQRASSGNDGRAAAAARRTLLLVAAALQAGPASPAPNATDPDTAVAAPVRVAAARIDMASSGEAILVLSQAVAHPAAGPQAVVSVPVARLAGRVPAARIDARLATPATNIPQLAAPLTFAAKEDTSAAETAAAGDSIALARAHLGELAALTIPVVTLAAADAPDPAAADLALPQVIEFGDAPPEFALALTDVALVPALHLLHLEPLRLLDLAALPELVKATPLAPRPLLAPAQLAIDWLAGFDASRFAEDSMDRAHKRLVNALSAQADTGVMDDQQAVRLAIARLETLVRRIGDLHA